MPSLIDEYTTAALPISMQFGDTHLAQGTAFVWRQDLELFLITNWHNVSGRNPRTGKHLSAHGGEPDNIKVYWHVDPLTSRVWGRLPIRDKMGAPLWWIHPKFGNLVDVVAIPLDLPSEIKPYPINKMPSKKLRMQIGQDAFILGFPYGIGTFGLPVWKRASFATEPDIIDPNDPHMLFDSASKPGMSGSPIIQRTWGHHMLEGGDVLMDGRPGTRFVGIYSGRLTSDGPNDPQLGMGWPAFLLEEILAARKRDI